MATTHWLDPDEQHAWRAYLRMQSRLQRRLSQQLQRDAGLSDADFEVLVNLSEAEDGRLRAFELGDELQWEKSRLSHHLTRMERRSLVAREECLTDARGAFVRITEQGRASIEHAAPMHVAEVRARFIDVLTPAQLRSLDEICETVLAALED
jgi:DNA-binding MarR family transcriptional regulator